MGNYTNPDAAGCLLEATACAQVIRELERVTEKFKRKIEREAEKRREELRAALKYESLTEIHDAYGYDMITEQQYQLYTELFERGEAALEDHVPTRAERVHHILLSIRRELNELTHADLIHKVKSAVPSVRNVIVTAPAEDIFLEEDKIILPSAVSVTVQGV